MPTAMEAPVNSGKGRSAFTLERLTAGSFVAALLIVLLMGVICLLRRVSWKWRAITVKYFTPFHVISSPEFAEGLVNQPVINFDEMKWNTPGGVGATLARRSAVPGRLWLQAGSRPGFAPPRSAPSARQRNKVYATRKANASKSPRIQAFWVGQVPRLSRLGAPPKRRSR